MCPPPNEKITRHAAVSAGLSVRGSVRQSHAAVPHPTRIQPTSTKRISVQTLGGTVR